MIVYASKGKRYIGFKRVNYGKATTPVDKREYRLEGIPSSPVGMRQEIKEFMLKRLPQYDGVALIDNISSNGELEIVDIKDL